MSKRSIHLIEELVSLNDIPDQYIEVISAMYKNNTGVVKVGNEIRS